MTNFFKIFLCTSLFLHQTTVGKAQIEPAAAPVDSTNLQADTLAGAGLAGAGLRPVPTARKYSRYDPETDVMLNPPVAPCLLAAETRDDFTGEIRRETQPEAFFRHTNPALKSFLKEKSQIVCDASITSAGGTMLLNLTFFIRDPSARNAFGGVNRAASAMLKLVDGSLVALPCYRADDGKSEENGQAIVYRSQFVLDPGAVKNLRRKEIDKVRIAWNRGFEDYEVFNVDLLQHQLDCLLGESSSPLRKLPNLFKKH